MPMMIIMASIAPMVVVGVAVTLTVTRMITATAYAPGRGSPDLATPILHAFGLWVHLRSKRAHPLTSELQQVPQQP